MLKRYWLTYVHDKRIMSAGCRDALITKTFWCEGLQRPEFAIHFFQEVAARTPRSVRFESIRVSTPRQSRGL
jgi:hypothetical protein